jgi:Mn2+/Fe2+ NRAMP family transporter
MVDSTATAAPESRAQPTVSYPPIPESYSRGWVHLARAFGPGVVVASVSVGTGETIFAPRLGAMFGYQMLWAVLFAIVVKAILVYTGARHLVLTGEHPLQAWARAPGPKRWIPALLGGTVAISFPFWIAALTGAVANLCVWISGQGSVRGWGIGLLVVLMTLAAVQTYHIIERVSTVFLTLKIVMIFIAILVVRPDWGAAVMGLFVPSLPEYEPWVRAGFPAIVARPTLFQVAVFLGVVGGGLQDYIGYVGMMREKRWGVSDSPPEGAYRLPAAKEQIARARQWLRPAAIDIGFSFAAVLIMTACFMILGAAVLHPQHAVPTDADLYSQQSQFLGIIHPGLVSLYKAGIFVAIFATIYGAFELYTYSAREPLQAVWPKRDWSIARLRLWITAYSGFGAMAIIWSGNTTVKLIEIISPLTGVLGCGLWCLGMLWVDRTQLPGAYRMKPYLLAGTVLAGISMVALGGYTTIARWLPGLLP